MASAVEDNLSCAVCLEIYDDPHRLHCGHSYCLKCILCVLAKSCNQSVLKCPICQTESTLEDCDESYFMKNGELNSLVMSYTKEHIAFDKSIESQCFCEVCDCDPPTLAHHSCMDCKVMYCDDCLDTCHPKKGKIAKHKIVIIDENFKRRQHLKNDDGSVYCKECDILVLSTDVGSHKDHEVMTLDRAQLLFKMKLEEATGGTGVMRWTLESCLDKSKEKLKFVETVFEEAELELIRKRDEILSKIRADIDEAKAGVENLMPAITAYRELQSRTDAISFIADCQQTLQGPLIKHDFDEVCSLFDRIEKLTCNNAEVLTAIRKIEIYVPPETERPRITKIGHAIKQRTDNNVSFEWTKVKNAKSYKVFSNVNDSATHGISTWSTAYTLNAIDGDNVPVVWVTALVDGEESLPSASLTVPTITWADAGFGELPNIKFNHRRAGEQVCVSTDGMKITSVKHAFSLLGDHFPGSARGLKDPATVLGTPILMTGLLYWEVEIAARDANAIHLYSFGVSPSISPGDHHFQEYDGFWVVLKCDGSVPSMNVKMMHKSRCLHEEVILWRDIGCDGQYDRYGLLLDIDNHTLSVSYIRVQWSNTDDESCRSLFTFANVDTSKGVTPMFRVGDFATLSLVNPDCLQPERPSPLIVKSRP